MMHHRLTSLGSLLLTFLLAACSSYAPPENLAGMTREALVAQMGQPDMERRLDGGSRLEFPRGPFGIQTWFVYLDALGRASHAEQVLTEQNFQRVDVGMTQDEVRRLLGRPSEVRLLGRNRGVVWSYRYTTTCTWFQVELSPQQVRSAGYGEPPECDRRAERSDG
jgi:outer membrane protein assembly factor BamE (lipoprotein component of BamABCDE complex)